MTELVIKEVLCVGEEEAQNFSVAGMRELVNRRAQKATKYTDEEIRQVIDGALDSPIEFAAGNALCAQAMVMYNEMIDRRWRNG
jgi:hypothetical protein